MNSSMITGCSKLFVIFFERSSDLVYKSPCKQQINWTVLFQTNAKPEKVQVDDLKITKGTNSLGVIIFMFKICGTMKRAFI